MCFTQLLDVSKQRFDFLTSYEKLLTQAFSKLAKKCSETFNGGKKKKTILNHGEKLSFVLRWRDEIF